MLGRPHRLHFTTLLTQHSVGEVWRGSPKTHPVAATATTFGRSEKPAGNTLALVAELPAAARNSAPELAIAVRMPMPPPEAPKDPEMMAAFWLLHQFMHFMALDSLPTPFLFRNLQGRMLTWKSSGAVHTSW